MPSGSPAGRRTAILAASAPVVLALLFAGYFGRDFSNVISDHIHGFEPVLCSKHQNAIRALTAKDHDNDQLSQTNRTQGDHARCRAVDDSRICLLPATISFRPTRSCNALQPKPLTRGLSVGPQARSYGQGCKEIRLRADPAQPQDPVALDAGEREEIAEDRLQSKPNIDLDIQFDYNSADISASSMSSVQALGRALSNSRLEGLDLRRRRSHRLGRHGETFNLGSVRTPRRLPSRTIWSDKFGIAGSDLVTVGYGKDKPKDAGRADGPDQPPRSGRQHGHQDRLEVTATC